VFPILQNSGLEDSIVTFIKLLPITSHGVVSLVVSTLSGTYMWTIDTAAYNFNYNHINQTKCDSSEQICKNTNVLLSTQLRAINRNIYHIAHDISIPHEKQSSMGPIISIFGSGNRLLLVRI
jgi:hypothetical protein